MWYDNISVGLDDCFMRGHRKDNVQHSHMLDFKPGEVQTNQLFLAQVRRKTGVCLSHLKKALFFLELLCVFLILFS